MTTGTIHSLDPRVARLPVSEWNDAYIAPADQLVTFEVFVKPSADKPFQHEGIVHSPDPDLAFVLAKETFTRRFTCVSLCVVKTEKVIVSRFSEGDENAWSALSRESAPSNEPLTSWEVYHLGKRGKQHLHTGSVTASSAQQAWTAAREKFNPAKPACNLWAIRTADIVFTDVSQHDFWITLPEKKFRDASDYKGGDKLKKFLSQNEPTIKPV